MHFLTSVFAHFEFPLTANRENFYTDFAYFPIGFKNEGEEERAKGKKQESQQERKRKVIEDIMQAKKNTEHPEGKRR